MLDSQTNQCQWKVNWRHFDFNVLEQQAETRGDQVKTDSGQRRQKVLKNHQHYHQSAFKQTDILILILGRRLWGLGNIHRCCKRTKARQCSIKVSDWFRTAAEACRSELARPGPSKSESVLFRLPGGTLPFSVWNSDCLGGCHNTSNTSEILGPVICGLCRSCWGPLVCSCFHQQGRRTFLALWNIFAIIEFAVHPSLATALQTVTWII